MVVGGKGGAGSFEDLTKQYWDTWNAASNGFQTGSGADAFSLPEGIQQWARLMSVDAPADLAAVLQRFGEQGGNWYSQMHQVAERFAGKDTSAAEVASAWREAISGREDEMLRWLLEAGKAGVAFTGNPALLEMLKAFGSSQGQSPSWLEMPMFGPAREHQTRWQALLKAQRDHQQQVESYLQQLRGVLEDAFTLFETRLAEHESSDNQLGSARALFDLWIEVAEEAYAKVALSDHFQQVYGELANAHMRLRAAAQAEVEQACQAVGLPTRAEMDTAHRKIAELERMLRKLMRAHEQASSVPPPEARNASSAKKRAPVKKTSSATGNKPASAATPPRPRKPRAPSP
jgi:class III poly(R)-hydroxyalkanoic acid synthase PhaE subunit